MAEDFEIRAASARDMDEVEQWLREELRPGEGGFLHNINIIQAGARKGALRVVANARRVMAFALGLIDILEVRPEFRRRGVGRRLVDDCVVRAKDAGMLGLRIHCKPRSSVPFWTRTGFAVLNPDDDRIEAVYPLAGHRELPASMPRVAIQLDLIGSRTGRPLAPSFLTDAAGDAANGYVLRDEYVRFYGNDYGALLTVRIDGVVRWGQPRRRVRGHRRGA